MADKVCTRFIDDDGLDIGCHLISKEFMLENYPDLVPWMKAPAVWTWGSFSFGNLGDDTSISKSSPVQTISSGTNWKQVSAGSFVTAAIKTDGTLWTWGNNSNGQIGDGTSIPRSSPVQTVSGGTNWKQISADSHMGAIKTDGTLWMWGINNNGQLGDGTAIPKSSPVQTVSGGTNWKFVSSSSNVIGAIKTDGTLWTWGISGRLGDNTSIAKSSPVQTVSGGTNWKSVSTGAASGAIKTDGTLWMWGLNSSGELGNDQIIATGSQSSPVQTISGGTNWKNIAAGGGVTAAIKTDGTLWFWGNGYQKFNGQGNVTDRSSPVQIASGGTNWKSIYIGSLASNVAAIKTDGTLWTWGTGGSGRLGNNSTIDRSSPVQTVSGGTDWRSIALSTCAAIAIRDEGDF